MYLFAMINCSIHISSFCLGTGVPTHSAGGVGWSVRTYVHSDQPCYNSKIIDLL